MLEPRARRYVDPEEVEICMREDGSEWLLGKGNYGQVRACRRFAAEARTK